MRMKSNRTAYVETKSVEPQLSDRIRSRIEIVSCIKRIVASEIPGSGVELLCARLDYGTQSSSRGEPVLSAVVRCLSAELSKRVNRGHYIRSAGAAPIRSLSAVDKPEVVSLTQPVKTYIGVPAG